MQRRAAAAFVALFLVLGSVSLTLIATAEAPEFDVEGKTLQQGDTLTVGGTQYTVTTVEAATSSGGGGHGGGGGTVEYTAVFEWTNESARQTTQWDHNSTVEFDNETWTVLIENASDPTTFTLREDINETAILMDDPDARNELQTVDGEQYVVVDTDGNKTLVPYDEYFPEPETRQYEEGETIEYEGNDATIPTVTSSAATLTWIAPETKSVEVSQQGNVTLGGQTFFAYFPAAHGGAQTVIISDNFQALQQYNENVRMYDEHTNGLWGVSIVSMFGAVLLMGLAYMPSRY